MRISDWSSDVCSSDLDWRSCPNDLIYRPCTLPEPVVDNCKKLLKALDLVYGAFDFVQSLEGELFFLEVNPAGEWAWLVLELDLPLRDAFIYLFLLQHTEGSLASPWTTFPNHRPPFLSALGPNLISSKSPYPHFSIIVGS